MKRGRFLATATAAATTTFALPLRAQVVNPGLAQEFAIGVSVPLSGPLQQYGQQIVKGVQAAIDENNRYAVPLQSVFGMRALDDQNSLALAITNAQLAAADPSVLGMIGNLTTDITLNMLPQYSNLGLPVIVPASTADAITSRGYRNVWRLPTKDSTEGALFARTVLPIVKPKFALAVTQDGDYGNDTAKGFVQQAGTQKFHTDGYIFPIASPNYPAAARSILDRQPDYVFLCGKTADMGPLIPELRKAGYTGTFGASDGFYNQSTLQTYGAQLKGTWVSSSLAPLSRASSDYQTLADFERYYGDITILSAFGYAAAQIIIAATHRVSATTHLALLQALQSTTAYDTLAGPFTFNFNGDPLDPNLYFYSIGDTSFTYEKQAHPSGFVL